MIYLSVDKIDIKQLIVAETGKHNWHSAELNMTKCHI